MNKFIILFLLLIFKVEAQTSALNIADSLYAYGKYTDAIKHYKTYKNQAAVYTKIAKAYAAVGNYDEALKNYELSIKANPKAELLKYEYAKLLSRTKKYNKASKVFHDLIYQDHKNPNYQYELGMVLEKLKDSTASNRFFNAVVLDSTHQKAIYRLAKIYLQNGEHKKVKTYVDKGLSTYKNNLQLINLKAQNNYLQQNYREAMVWFKKLITLGEKSGFIYEKLSLCYAQIFNYEKAIENGLKALKFNPNDATVTYVIGTHYFELKAYDKAEEYISKAIFLLDKPLDAEYVKLATTLNHQKKYPEAIKTFKKAIKENPENEYTHLSLAVTLENYYADYDAKLKVYEDFKKKFPNSKIKSFVDSRISKIEKQKLMNTD